MEATWNGTVSTLDAGLTLLLPFIQKEIPSEPALRAYSLTLVTGIRTGNMKTAITEEVLAPFGATGTAPKEIYEALEEFGSSLREGIVELPGVPQARVVAVDTHVPQKFGKSLQKRYNSMRGRATQSIPTLTVADVSSKHADPIFVEVLKDAGERGPPLLLRIIPKLKSLNPELTLFDGEFTSGEVACRFASEEMDFIGRLRSNALLAKGLKPLLLEEGKLYSLRTFDSNWGGGVTVFGFLRHGRRFYYVSNLDLGVEELKERFGWRWRIENFFRDASFIDEFPGSSQVKAKAHIFLSALLGRLTKAFGATVKTMCLLIKAVKKATISGGRILVELRSLPKRLLEKLRSYVSYLCERLGVNATLQLIPVKSKTTQGG